MELNFTCPTHGEYAGQPDCPRCRQSAVEAEGGFRRRWADYEHWTRCGIPARYRSRTLDNWQPDGADQEAAAKIVESFASGIQARVSAGDGLSLLGPPGTGKTHLLAALVTAGCEVGIRGLYWCWPDLIATHRRAMRAPEDDPAKTAMDRAAVCPLLALDEVGHGAGTDWERLALFELLDTRYREGRSTLVASNATAKTLANLIGERLVDRLRETNVPVLLPGPSQRGHVHHDSAPAMIEPPGSIEVTGCYQGSLEARTIERPRGGNSRRFFN